MIPVGVIGLGAGAFVTTTVAATFVIRRRISAPVDEEWVQVDLVEKGLSDVSDAEVEVYQAKHGNGWKEYSGEEEKFEPGLLAPLVIHDQLAAHSATVPRESRTPLSPGRIFPTPPRWQAPPEIPDVPEHIPSPQRSPALVPTALLSADGPQVVVEHVPTGSGMAMTLEAEVPLESGAEVPSSEVASCPAESSAPDDEPISPSDTMTPVPSATSILQLELIPPTPLALEPISLPVIISPLTIKTPVIQELEDAPVRPVLDIKSPIGLVNPFRSPSAHSPPEDDLPPPPVYTRYDTAKSPIDPELIETILSPLPHSVTTVNVFIVDEAMLASRVPLPLSIPSTPKPMVLDDDYMEDCHPVDYKKDMAELGVSDSIHSPMTPDSIMNPEYLSDIDSDMTLSISGPSAPNTPTESSKESDLSAERIKGEPVVDCTPPSVPADKDNNIRISEVMEVPDDLDRPPTPDPPEPTSDLVLLLPGSFGHQHTVSRLAQTSASVSLMTGDIVQLCKAILAVSNCAGLVAQFVVGFSVWWSLMLVPV